MGFPMIKFETARLLWIVIGYIGSLVIIVLSLVPAAARPHSGIGGQYEHWIAYALVGLAFGMGYRPLRPQLYSGLTLTVGAAILELLQNFIPRREPELIGFVASSLGAWFGLALAVFCGAIFRAISK
jgi:VanZ family protein